VQVRLKESFSVVSDKGILSLEHFPQDLKESVFVEVLGLFRTFAREFRQWKAAEYSG